jgi:hypothetical protein
MASWYKVGTITVTNGSTTVTGSGTVWILNAQVGEALYAPDGRLYEITNIASDTSFTIAPAYLGSTQSGQEYVIVPSQSYIRDLAAQAADLVNQYSTIANTVGTGKFGDGTVTNPGIRFADDLDTGLYRIGANILGVSAGGAERVRVDTSGVKVTGTFEATGGLTTDAINDTPIGGTTPSTGAFTNLSYTGTLTGSTGVMNIGSGQVYKDASGNVGIGTSSPVSFANYTVLTVNGTNSDLELTRGGSRHFAVVTSSTSTDVTNVANVPLTFGTNAVERMRIDTSGRLLFGQSVTANPGSGNTTEGIGFDTGVGFFSKADNFAIRSNRNSDGGVISLRRSGNDVGSISVTTTATAYNTSSDYRLKENVTPIEDAIERVKQIPVHRFNFKADPDKTVDGFLAHEVQEFVPEAVTGTKDAMRTEEYEVEPAKGEIFIPAIEEVLDDEGEVVTEAVAEQIIESDVSQPETLEDGQQWREITPKVMGEREVPDYQGIDQSKLVPVLMAALQEAIARIEELEAKVNA